MICFHFQHDIQMLHARVVQMMTFLVEMVICHRNHSMTDRDIMEENGIMRNVAATIVDLRRCVRKRISIIVNSLVDEAVVEVVAVAAAEAVEEVPAELTVSSAMNVMW